MYFLGLGLESKEGFQVVRGVGWIETQIFGNHHLLNINEQLYKHNF